MVTMMFLLRQMRKCVAHHFRSGFTDQFNEKHKLLGDITKMKHNAEERQKALKAAAKAEKDANKKKADLHLSAMRQSRADDCNIDTHAHTH